MKLRSHQIIITAEGVDHHDPMGQKLIAKRVRAMLVANAERGAPWSGEFYIQRVILIEPISFEDAMNNGWDHSWSQPGDFTIIPISDRSDKYLVCTQTHNSKPLHKGTQRIVSSTMR